MKKEPTIADYLDIDDATDDYDFSNLNLVAASLEKIEKVVRELDVDINWIDDEDNGGTFKSVLATHASDLDYEISGLSDHVQNTINDMEDAHRALCEWRREVESRMSQDEIDELNKLVMIHRLKNAVGKK